MTLQESIHQHHLTRFYVKPRDEREEVFSGGSDGDQQAGGVGGGTEGVVRTAEPVATGRPHIAIFVGNLPIGLSQKQYEKILLSIIGAGA